VTKIKKHLTVKDTN